MPSARLRIDRHRKHRRALLAFCIAVGVCNWAPLGFAQWHEFGENGLAQLCVPDSDLNPYTAAFNNESRNLRPQSGWAPGFGFLFDEARVRRSIPEFRSSPALDKHIFWNKLVGSIGLVHISDWTRWGPAMRARSVEDLWTASGPCSARTFEQLEGGLYRAKCSAKDDWASIWSRISNASEPMPPENDFVVAACNYRWINTKAFPGTDVRECSRVILHDGLIIDYHLQETNIMFFDRIDEFLKSKVRQWRQNCLL